ncbi:UDP-glucose dehydrogenase family protein [Corynebacterium bovis]|uniref:UDP-glucose 6-dehydrogenase n=2 Tax=Corynebacterium bovis TaxID=36808 RepID=A0A8H9YBF8_9CORY|nr:UDP-glucose/GDP-mannose dehydrogenase family protein [Corynebacterium bovis]MBB3116783.1 UDPglucose 6-dehydrogenase [Corynebacterium bovis DSM 20582 = CIP 54.80]QQC46734.1 UDP-glucose/GDP-mannose dehydrogenase family protein [Corynebacterium bovis]RRO80177.1 UDP-glucose/GDP-mannose dehydrogenase family protein [Corynebacterium bovis]RRO82033.1 UDP-glucose/GDP-mannose dehydrogenase family protein [Corynebacterium bovis]RRO92553.1 UDP-glucose/GDP-mannose dehydrogenase family protein [Coryneba
MKMTVFGTGYLGATHAACMAELGHDVLGVDVDARKVEMLNAGTVPFYEPGLEEILARGLREGRLRFTTDPSEAVRHATVHFIGVGTPQRKGSYRADTRYVEAVVDTLTGLVEAGVGPGTATGDGDGPVGTLDGASDGADGADGTDGAGPVHLVLGKSTVPVGTAHALRERAGDALEICWNPEFLREGKAVEDTMHPDRIVLGTDRPGGRAERVAREVYAQPLAEGTPLLVTDLPTAELVKVSANAFLATKISFINAVSEVCEAADADVTQLAAAIGLDERIGPKFLGAGLGFGGGCLPKDIRAFMARAGELGADQALTFLREVDAINMRRREKMVQLCRKACGGSVLGHNITVLGAAFKPESDDVRDSPALNVAGALSLAGAQVTVYDPQAMDNARQLFPTLGYASGVEEALAGAEVVVLATEWREFRRLDPAWALRCVRGEATGGDGAPGAAPGGGQGAAAGAAAGDTWDAPVMLDGRNCLDAEAWTAAGWEYQALGRGRTAKTRTPAPARHAAH